MTQSQDYAQTVKSLSCSEIDTMFYKKADDFFYSNLPNGLTYDDISLSTLYSEVLPKDTILETSISDKIHLNIPIISSDMDTVTESKMAIEMALNGGMGIIHYNIPKDLQIKEVARVKNHVHGLIQDPIQVRETEFLGDILNMVEEKGYSFRTFPVVDEKGKLVGLLPGRVLKQRYANQKVGQAMMSRNEVFTLTEKQLKPDPITAADKFFTEHIGIHKLLVVDENEKLRGLFTLSDIEQINEEAQLRLKPARDDDFRLRCGAAISAERKEDGQIDKDKTLSHIQRLVDENIDAIAISTAHGFTQGVGDTTSLIKKEFPDVTIIAGNVTSARGVEFLAKSGADCIKIGQGPGSICTTRIVAGVGIPQMSALYVASKAAQKMGVRILADGGITKSGDIVKALTLADAVICGGILAGCKEAPGNIIEINNKFYKQYRGMGSHEAMAAGSAARYGHSKKDVGQKVAAEGVEALKEISGSVKSVLNEIIGGIQSGLGYLGAKNLIEHRSKAQYIRVSPAGQKESAPHDVIQVKNN